jgi:hypothetical protein
MMTKKKCDVICIVLILSAIPMATAYTYFDWVQKVWPFLIFIYWTIYALNCQLPKLEEQMKKVSVEKRKVAMVIVNLLLTLVTVMALVAITPKNFWSNPVFPKEIWILLSFIAGLSIATIMRFKQQYAGILASLMIISLIGLIVSNTAPALARELNIVANYNVHWTTYATLAFLSALSIFIWRFIKRNWTGKSNQELGRFFQ